MSDQLRAERGLHFAVGLVEVLRVGLHHRQEDLLELETVTDRIVAGRATARTLTDQAEDLRRGLDAHRLDQLVHVRSVVVETEAVLSEAGVDGRLESGRAWTDAYASMVTLVVARRAELDLAEASRALAPIARAGVDEPGLALRARAHLAESCRRLEMVHRGLFRLSRELPKLEKSVGALPDPPGGVDARPPVRAAQANPSMHHDEPQLFPPSINATRHGPAAPGF